MSTDFEALLTGIKQGKLVSGTLSSPRNTSEGAMIKTSIRPLIIKSKQMYQLTDQDKQKAYHRNLTPEACALFIKEAFDNYMQGLLTLPDCQYQVLVSKQNKMTVIVKEMKTELCIIPHNRTKNHVLQEGVPVPFLVALGIMSSDGRVIAKKYDKFRQINRFLEMVRDVIDELPKDHCLEIVDFGCGKAYLTFALYYYLHDIEKRAIRIKGLDLKKEVIVHCQGLADQLHLEGLTFAVGDINDFESAGDVDLMISLHACDTATDAALEKAVRWNTRVILCVPCCQHELFSQVQSSKLDTLFRHGILKERIAALATDAARADILTILGYEVQVLEFIDMEHTPKNLLLRAVKGVSAEKRKQAKERYQLFKNELKISPSLEKRFSREIKLFV
ncbi:MAG TPA: SAM-dependent methyltransferase [Parachlamydiaceae bacterium]|nr:SAM-dependent methyltransferase [Parachlamydiaceae bacterium]